MPLTSHDASSGSGPGTDAEWPHTTKTNAPIRREFKIPIRSCFVK
jgi:hypothetical protein